MQREMCVHVGFLGKEKVALARSEWKTEINCVKQKVKMPQVIYMYLLYIGI